jgi:streptogramin lyase
MASQTRLPGGGSLNLATGFGKIWVTGIGATYALSQDTGRIVATVATPGTFPSGCGSGIATGAGAVWVTHDCRGVYRINPRTCSVTASIRVANVGDAIAVADGLVWVTTVYGVPLRIQPETDRVSRVTEKMNATIPVGGTTQVVFWGGSEWKLALRRSLVLLRFDPTTDRIIGPPVAVGRPIPPGQGTEPSSMAAGPTGLWVLDYYRQTLFHLVLTKSTP